MTKASFRFSPAILARLGEELNQSVDQSILELVKNAFDANATSCSIELVNTGAPGGSIKIIDDGDGMSALAIKNSWLVLGKSSKSTAVRTRLGRVPAGNKGLGRLAALRLGRYVELSAVELKNARRLHELKISWDVFDNADTVEDVELEIDSKKNARGGKGVTILLQELRVGIRQEEVKRLARSLLLLTDPFQDRINGFNVQLVAPEFKDIQALLEKKYFDQAEYHLIAELDQNGQASAVIQDWQGKVLARADHAVLRRKQAKHIYMAPPVVFDLWVFLLSSDEFTARRVTKAELSNWLNTFGGVHIYQGDIRVAPYGNAGSDWLDMNLARVKNPEERPSTNTSIGRVVMPGSGNYEIKQKTDRSGFIEGDSFLALREFAIEALNWMARWRLERAEARRSNEREVRSAIAAEKEKVEAVIGQIPPEMQEPIRVAFASYAKSRDREAGVLKKEVQLYRTLSTAGITAATFSHESLGNSLKTIDLCTGLLAKRIKKTIKDPGEQLKLIEPVEAIQNESSNLATLGIATLGLIRAQKRRLEKIFVHESISAIISLMQPFIAGRDAEVELTLDDGSPFLRTSSAALESIFANLINNSLKAFERGASAKRIIYINTEVFPKSVSIIFSDSGPGIIDLKISEIWLPGVTTNDDGTGLGLTIVKDTVKDMGAKISVKAHGSHGGAEFTLQLPILGA